MLVVSIFFASITNLPFLRGVMAGRTWYEPASWLFVGAMLVLIAALHMLLLCLVPGRRMARPVLSVLLVLTAFATYYMERFGVYLDPTMLRNVLRTDLAEAVDLLAWDMLPHVLLYGVLPTVLIWRLRLTTPPPPLRALALRLTALAATAGLLLVTLLLVFQDLSAVMRNQKELRYLITPANYLYSAARVLGADARGVNRIRATVGSDARLADSWRGRSKPALFILVVGETARASNWGLNGYARQTTPRLARLDVLNFEAVTACGTNTETSLPCMFSAVGRRDYDAERIRNSESLLHVLARAGFAVLWRDNQSGCKGVCANLPQELLSQTELAGLCEDGRCLDEVLLRGLDAVAEDSQGNMAIVLHMIGNHGPAYYKRYPAEFRRFVPPCETGELRKCSRQEIVNAYDNALSYTDHVLARTIQFLRDRSAKFDTAMLYVSDHGESLGEGGLYLHGVPLAIAPSEQTRVPMVWWLSSGFTRNFGLDRSCLAAKTTRPLSHDHLFHSVLGLLQIQTQAYDRDLDVSAGCRP